MLDGWRLRTASAYIAVGLCVVGGVSCAGEALTSNAQGGVDGRDSIGARPLAKPPQLRDRVEPSAEPSSPAEPTERPRGQLPVPPQPTQAARIQVQAVMAPFNLPAGDVSVGHFRIHLIDVGTGLSILVQGHDFNLLYDGGSNDDGGKISARGNNNRLLSYLYGAIGPSGPKECQPDGDLWPQNTSNSRHVIDNVFLSHPHRDHASMLADVVHCYAVGQFWDAGVRYGTIAYNNLLSAIAVALPTIEYRIAGSVYQSSSPPSGMRIPSAAQTNAFFESKPMELGKNASLVVLHADGTSHPSDANRNSTVVRLDLGSVRMLLVGDAEGGSRENPSARANGTERYLLDNHRDALRADILQVGHHGSMTSSRLEFIQAVAPSYALFGVGPRPYAGIVLPDQAVVDAISQLPSAPQIIRTDVHDREGCPIADRFGVDNSSPAGCDNYVLTF